MGKHKGVGWTDLLRK